MPKTILTPKQELDIVKDYTDNKLGIYPICEKYHIGKIKLKQILSKYEIALNNRGKQPLDIEFKVKDFREKKYIDTDKVYHVAYDEKTDFESPDIDNNGGTLTTYIEKQYGVKTPTIYDRRKYYMTTGNYWWEQWLKVKCVERPKVKKCPYCDWETADVNNKSGAFEMHLKRVHNMSKFDYINDFPDDEEYFYLVYRPNQLRLFETDENKFIRCKICGEKMVKMTSFHLKKHNISREEYVEKYGIDNMVAKSFHDRMSEVARANNENMTFHRISSNESEIGEFIRGLGFETKMDRTVLSGQELDIYIPEKRVAIEYDGLYWHNELFKEASYHASKTKLCQDNNVRLIHIFEDEWNDKQDIVKSRLKNILGITERRIYARKCTVSSQLTRCELKDFLDENHIQGDVGCNYYYGLYYDGELVSVMTFGKTRKSLGQSTVEGQYELLRFCNKLDTTVIGGAGKLLKHFIQHVHPKKIITYADKRWSDGNLYEQLGFKYTHDSKPNYFYVIRNKRENRFNFRKQVLVKKYGCPKDMSEHNFCISNKWYRIYDCGTKHYEILLK